METLIKENRDFMKALAYKFTRNPVEAEDLVQEVLMKILKYKHQFTEGTNFKNWVSVIMRNTYINLYRKKRKHDKYIQDSALMPGPSSVKNTVFSNFFEQDLASAIDSMPNKHKSMINYLIVGKNYKEIAQLEKKPLGTIKSRIHKARKTLKEKLVKKDYAFA